jgi:SAM-dependent methyltransferase
MHIASNWWSTFFRGTFLEIWRRAAGPEMTEPEVDFLERELALEPGARILDAPCGFGRHALSLARRGYAVRGIDIAGEYIAQAEAAAREEGLDASFVQGDVQDLSLEAEFDGAYCVGNSFAYFDDAGNRRFIERLFRALKPGARLVLETGVVAESIFPNLEARTWGPLGDLLFLAARSYDPATGRLSSEYTCVEGGKVDTAGASYQVYLHRELVALLESAGFTGVTSHGGLEGEPFALGSRDLFLTALKR